MTADCSVGACRVEAVPGGRKSGGRNAAAVVPFATIEFGGGAAGAAATTGCSTAIAIAVAAGSGERLLFFFLSSFPCALRGRHHSLFWTSYAAPTAEFCSFCKTLLITECACFSVAVNGSERRLLKDVLVFLHTGQTMAADEKK